MKNIFRDRDYIQDEKGDIYQVIGSLHIEGGIMALQKYKKVKSNNQKVHKSMIPTDPIQEFKQHEMRYWKQKETNNRFIRILPNYSSQSAKNNIKNNEYLSHSSVFDTDLIIIPPKKVKIHWNPQKRLQNLIKIMKKGDFDQRKKLDTLERETIEVAYLFNEKFDIGMENIGVSGSILWGAHHSHSDIDLMIYGNFNTEQILNNAPINRSQDAKLRNYMKVEILPIAEKMSIKTGLPMEECFEYIYNKPYLFFYRDRKVSVTFAPSKSELVKIPLYTKKTRFHPLFPVKIEAKVEKDTWGFYYPGLFLIKGIDMLDSGTKDKNQSKNETENQDRKKNEIKKVHNNPIGRDYQQNNNNEYLEKLEIQPKNITRLLVFEHELVGYYRCGDKIEIRGLLQKAENIPQSNSLDLKDTYQILVGGYETFGKEYIRKI